MQAQCGWMHSTQGKGRALMQRPRQGCQCSSLGLNRLMGMSPLVTQGLPSAKLPRRGTCRADDQTASLGSGLPLLSGTAWMLSCLTSGC